MSILGQKIYQRLRCSPDEALQKLGRAARGGLMNGEKAIFFWLPESKVVGPRVCDLQPDKQLKHRVKRYNRKRPLLPGEGLITQTDTDIATRLDTNLPKRKTKRAPRQKNGVTMCLRTTKNTNCITQLNSVTGKPYWPSMARRYRKL